MSGEEKINTSVTDRMTLIAQGVCKEFMLPCEARERERIDTIEEEVSGLKTSITEGFKEIKDSIFAKEEKKESKIWELTIVIIQVVLGAVVIFKH